MKTQKMQMIFAVFSSFLRFFTGELDRLDMVFWMIFWKPEWWTSGNQNGGLLETRMVDFWKPEWWTSGNQNGGLLETRRWYLLHRLSSRYLSSSSI